MKKIICFLVLICMGGALWAQKGTVRGNVYEKTSGSPIIFARVQLEGTKIGAQTDVEGFFTLPNIPIGNYTLQVSYVGFDNFSVPIIVSESQILYQNIYMVEASTAIGEVVVSGKKEQARNEVQVSKIAVTPKQIRSLPSAGGQADIAQYLTVLPGVIFTGDQGGQLYIRGGSPVQNRIFLDGMTIYNPFHSIGFFSVFETEIIRNVDIFTGGFNADYGGRISAVVDTKTREGNRKKFAGMVSAGPFQVKSVLEGPIIPLKSENGGSISFIATAKKSLIEQTAKQLYPDVNNKEGIPFQYTDFYGKVSLLTGNGSKLNLFGFNFDDAVNYQISDFGWKSKGGGLDFTMVPTNSNTIIAGTVTFSKYDSQILESDGKPRYSSVSGSSADLNFINYGHNTEIRYGMELTGFKTNFEYTTPLGFTFDGQAENSTELAAFFKLKQKLGNLVLEPGLRLQYYASLSTTSLEPRMGLKYNINNGLRFKAAGGIYSQNFLSTVNDRDIVNLFVGFLSAPTKEFYKPGTTEPTKHRLQKAWHLVSGFEKDLGKNFDVNVEGYYKKFSQLIGLNRNKTAESQPDFAAETGDAYGLDMTFKVEAKRSYFWGAYSLGYVNRNDGEQNYPPVFDRRHNLNLLGTYQFGKKRNLELGVRWNFGTGFPFTLTQGFYTVFNYTDGISTDVLTQNGDDLGILYDQQRNTGRLPTYHRMDISLKYTTKIVKGLKMEVTASATNVYNRENIFYFDRVRYERKNQLPFLPSLNMAFNWN